MNGNLYSQNNMSQIDMVLHHLILNGRITPEEAETQYKIKYLSKCISRLKEKNINIYSVFCDSEKRLDSKIKEYVLCKEQNPQIKRIIDVVKANHLQKIA